MTTVGIHTNTLIYILHTQTKINNYKNKLSLLLMSKKHIYTHTHRERENKIITITESIG